MQRGGRAAFGGDHHHSVGTLDSVNGCGYRIFEYGDGFDFHACEVVQVSRVSVNQHQRAVPVEPELGLVVFAAAGTLLHQEARELAVQRLCNINFRAFLEDCIVQRCARGGPHVVRIAEYDGIQLRGGFLGCGERADQKKRKDYVCR